MNNSNTISIKKISMQKKFIFSSTYNVQILKKKSMSSSNHQIFYASKSIDKLNRYFIGMPKTKQKFS